MEVETISEGKVLCIIMICIQKKWGKHYFSILVMEAFLRDLKKNHTYHVDWISAHLHNILHVGPAEKSI